MTRLRVATPSSIKHWTVEGVCRLVGISRQAHHRWKQRCEHQRAQADLVIEAVLRIRYRQPRLGGRKVYHVLRATHPDLMRTVGRDQLFAILRQAGLLVRPHRRTVRTTYSQRWRHRYPNLIRGVRPAYPGHVLVADITYLAIRTGFVYLALVTDLYSRKIIGYDLSRSLTMDGALRALRMALAQLPSDIVIIHHSDRGLQYYSAAYRQEIESRPGGQMSMTEDGNVYENAVAERVNGILKVEYDLYRIFDGGADASMAVREAIRLYNDERPHQTLSLETPSVRFTSYQKAQERQGGCSRHRQAAGRVASCQDVPSAPNHRGGLDRTRLCHERAVSMPETPTSNHP